MRDGLLILWASIDVEGQRLGFFRSSFLALEDTLRDLFDNVVILLELMFVH
jgi:hypothetical protein